MAELIAVETMVDIHITVNFADETHARRTLDKYAAQVTNVHYADMVQMAVRLKEKQIDALIIELTEQLKGQVNISTL